MDMLSHTKAASSSASPWNEPLELDVVALGDHGSRNSSPTHNSGSGISTDEVAHPGLSDSNPALAIRTKITLDIEPFPGDILEKINVAYAFRPAEKDGELFVPIVSLYQCVWEGVPTYLEEKSDVWAGSQYGTTTWLTSKRLGTFPSCVDESILNSLQGLEGTESNLEVVEKLTGKRYSEAKSKTVGRYIASLVSAGDNHVTLLTAAYCALFDRLWWYALSSSFPHYKQSCRWGKTIDASKSRREQTH